MQLFVHHPKLVEISYMLLFGFDPTKTQHLTYTLSSRLLTLNSVSMQEISIPANNTMQLATFTAIHFICLQTGVPIHGLNC